METVDRCTLNQKYGKIFCSKTFWSFCKIADSCGGMTPDQVEIAWKIFLSIFSSPKMHATVLQLRLAFSNQAFRGEICIAVKPLSIPGFKLPWRVIHTGHWILNSIHWILKNYNYNWILKSRVEATFARFIHTDDWSLISLGLLPDSEEVNANLEVFKDDKIWFDVILGQSFFKCYCLKSSKTERHQDTSVRHLCVSVEVGQEKQGGCRLE